MGQVVDNHTVHTTPDIHYGMDIISRTMKKGIQIIAFLAQMLLASAVQLLCPWNGYPK